MLVLCKALRTRYSIAAVTNDIFTREDCEFLTKNNALPAYASQLSYLTSISLAGISFG